MEKKHDRVLVIGFIILLFALSILFLLLPKETFSEMENRYLQQAPQLTWKHVVTKTFSERAESYVADHFPFRGSWIAVKAAAERFRLQKENNDIFQGENGYLLEKFTEPDWVQLQKYTDSVKRFVQSHPNIQFSFMLAPTSVGLNEELLPPYATVFPQYKVNQYVGGELQEDLRFLDGFDFLESEKSSFKPLYYRTDHHWTTHGAYLAYQYYAQSMGWTPYPESAFQIKTVTDSFLGSYHTKSQFNILTPDSIEAYLPKLAVSTERYVADNKQRIAGLYDESFLTKKDKYSYFLGGVHAVMKLSTKLEPKAVDVNKLLIIKDSYAHSVIPFLTLHVPEVHVIDMRYYNGSIQDYLAENEITHVLFLFNTTTLVSDPSLLKLR